jgi:hypothetical protein
LTEQTEPEAQAQALASPLAEPRIDSLDELFSRDPFKYNDQSIDQIVEILRQRRAAAKDAMENGTRAPRAKLAPKSKTTSIAGPKGSAGPKKEITIDDFDL